MRYSAGVRAIILGPIFSLISVQNNTKTALAMKGLTGQAVQQRGKTLAEVLRMVIHLSKSFIPPKKNVA